MTRCEKIKACFLLGACGDALGAPLEGIRDLGKILEKHGDTGLSSIIAFEKAYGKDVDYPPGRVTDDTTMLVTTAAAMTMTSLAPRPALAEDLRALMYQGYLNWVAVQDDAAHLAAKIDPALPWPDLARGFWFTCGAGGGTIASLGQEGPGTIASPHIYECTVRGKKVTSPNAGCGGMMRVAPLAFIEGLSNAEIFTLACDNAAITHGYPAAYVATGATALYVRLAAQGLSNEDILDETRKVLHGFETRAEYATGVRECLAAIDHGQMRARDAPSSLQVIDSLPGEIGHPNPFLAVPVLAQVTYALCSSRGADSVREDIVLAANHSGDSDSVASIVGNIIGARHGLGAIPQDWSSALIQRAEIGEMAERLDFAIDAARPRAAPGPKSHMVK
jgi:ADP-ribosylglycohydrolase